MRADSNPAATAAVLALLSVDAPAFSSPVATWITLPQSARLSFPAQWSRKRGAWYVDLRGGIPAASAAPLQAPRALPSPPVLSIVPMAAQPAPKPRRAPVTAKKATGCPAGWSEGAWALQCAVVSAKTYDSLKPEAVWRRAQSSLDRSEKVSAPYSFSATLRADGVSQTNNARAGDPSATDAARRMLALGAAPESITWTEAPAPVAEASAPAELACAA